MTITRLPKDSTTPCEPIYPDLLTVSDTVPKWVFDQTLVEVNKQAEEDYRNKKFDADMKKITTEAGAGSAQAQEIENEEGAK